MFEAALVGIFILISISIFTFVFYLFIENYFNKR